MILLSLRRDQGLALAHRRFVFSRFLARRSSSCQEKLIVPGEAHRARRSSSCQEKLSGPSTTVVLPSSPRKSSKGPGLKARKFALFQGGEAPCSLRNRGSTTVVLGRPRLFAFLR